MNRIKELRHEQGWSQFKLAEKMDCSVTSIAMYEIERRTPSLSVLLQLCELFNCSIDYILCRTNIRNNIKIDMTYEDLNIINSFQKLNCTNKLIIKNILHALLIQQELDEESKK